MRRGEIRWYRFASPDKQRPVLILTRDEVLGSLHEVLVVPTSRTVRGLSTEVILDVADGMPTRCALNADRLSQARLDRIGAWVADLPADRWPAGRDGHPESLRISVMQTSAGKALECCHYVDN